jgi:putative nucleotidyltransferase with HDIG domain
MRTIGPAHQYISKPCDPVQLQAILDRVHRMNARLANPAFRALVARITSLPSLPSAVQELFRELHSPEASIERVSELIGRDPAMSARLLQLVNSSFFGVSQRVTSVNHAATLLGLHLLKLLVLSIGMFTRFEKGCFSSSEFEQIVKHSYRVAQSAKQLAIEFASDPIEADDAFLAGLLHDIGKLALSSSNQIDYAKVWRTAQEQSIPVWQAEQNEFNLTHAEVGGYLLSLWGLPHSVVEAVLYHHEPSSSGRSGFCPLAAVHAANSRSQATGHAPAPVDRDFLTAAGMGEMMDDG